MKGLLRRLLRNERVERSSLATERTEPPRTFREAPVPDRRQHAISVDGNTRTFWARGEASATTVVEVEAPPPLEPGHPLPRGARAPAEPRPRGNPAFSETLFIELMRAGQFARAYEQLSPHCQSLWGSVENFAVAQSRSGLRAVQGVSVRDVRYLDRWTDPDTQVRHHNVAELFVEYTVGNRDHATRLERIVHLVPVEGRWRSICVPPQGSEAPSASR
jgi:hypothetical protein